MYIRQELECNGAPVIEYGYQPEPEEQKYSGGQVINAASDPLKANRYLVTLVHRYTGEEKLIDLLLDKQGFTAVMQEVRRHISYAWGFYEILDTAEPF